MEAYETPAIFSEDYLQQDVMSVSIGDGGVYKDADGNNFEGNG